MKQYSKVNAKSSNSQLNKLKSAVKYRQGLTLRMHIKMFKRNNLPHELSLRTRPKTKLKNAFENDMSTDIKLSKARLFKIIQSRGFLGKLLSRVAGPSMKVAVSLAKNILAPLGITAATSAIDAKIQKKIYGSGNSNLNNFKWTSEWHNGQEFLKVLKMRKITKRRIFRNVVRYFMSYFD